MLTRASFSALDIFIKFSVHIGHSILNSLIVNSWFILTYCLNIFIINLKVSLLLWKICLVGLTYACKYRSPIWFVNLDVAFSNIIDYFSKMAGECSFSSIWLNGFLSNYTTFISVYKRLRVKSKYSKKGSKKWVTDMADSWLLSRSSWPRLIFISSAYNSQLVIKEAFVKGILCFGVVDTNANALYVTLPFPGNDDSVNSIIYYTMLYLIIYLPAN